jgi:hypothetical protein
MAGPHSLVLVVVAFVRGVPVPVVDIIDMVAMLDSVMTAASLVSVAVISVGYVGQRVLVVVALVGGVRVTVVYIVGVSLVLDAGMPAARTVVMRVLGMDLVHVRSHRSSVRILTWLLAGRTSAQPVAMAPGPRGNSAIRGAEPPRPGAIDRLRIVRLGVLPRREVRQTGSAAGTAVRAACPQRIPSMK